MFLTLAGLLVVLTHLAVAEPEAPGIASLEVCVVLPVRRQHIFAKNALRSLKESVDEDPSIPVEIIVVETSSTGLISLERDSFRSLRRIVPTARWLENDSGATLSIPEAYNLGLAHCTSTYILFADDGIEFIPGLISEMLVPLITEPQVAIVGPRVMLPDGTLYAAWLDFALDVDSGGRRRSYADDDSHHHDYSFDYKYRDLDSYGSFGSYSTYGGYGLTKPERSVPVFSLQGVPGWHAALQSQRSVLAVPATCMLGVRDVINEVGGFRQELSPPYTDADLCLRVQRSGRAVVYWPGAEAVFHGRGAGSDAFEDIAASDSVPRAFTDAWDASLRTLETQRWSVSGVTVVWNMECGTGQVMGLTTEALNLLQALSDRVRLVAQVDNEHHCLTDVARNFPGHLRTLLGRLLRRSIPDDASIIQVIHRDPGRYSRFVGKSLPWSFKGKSYVVGRSMYETTGVPDHWIEPANSLVDEIWVPTTFNLHTFAEGGIRNQVVVVPEAIDTDLYDPEGAPTAELPDCLPYDAGRVFKFLSVGKWEERKGWKLLLQAYWSAFSATDATCLIIHSPLDHGNIAEFKAIKADIAESLGVSPSQLASVSIIQSLLPQIKLPSLYKAVDAFVLASRGEGWGLPFMEAMAMGLPTIGTNWSGNTEFMSDHNSFLVPVEYLERNNEGLQWARPNVTALASALRSVFVDPGGARQRGLRARQHITAHYSHSPVADRVVEQLQRIATTLKQRETNLNLKGSSLSLLTDSVTHGGNYPSDDDEVYF